MEARPLTITRKPRLDDGPRAQRFAIWIIAILLLANVSSVFADDASVSATMIRASNEDKPSDNRLKKIEPKLRKIFGFKTYQQSGSGSGRCSVPGETTLSLGGKFKLTAKIEDAGDKKLRVHIRWTEGKKAMIDTTMVRRRGDPIILGGPKQDDATLIVSLTVK
ncbi:MAG: hypothetical protein O2923_08485 [Verrucomicrobia bacterium]|nr:hypothetical protein [Verrucomicrobiota bacterium]MDA1087014.1 hypothetical protein [Verrucomicrobiota bacterium]